MKKRNKFSVCKLYRARCFLYPRARKAAFFLQLPGYEHIIYTNHYPAARPSPWHESKYAQSITARLRALLPQSGNLPSGDQIALLFDPRKAFFRAIPTAKYKLRSGEHARIGSPWPA